MVCSWRPTFRCPARVARGWMSAPHPAPELTRVRCAESSVAGDAGRPPGGEGAREDQGRRLRAVRSCSERRHIVPDGSQREILPIPDRAYNGFVACDAKSPDSPFPPIEPLRPPPGAPNVLVVLLDDVGFGAASAYGGPISTPTAERLAADRSK